MKQLELVQNPAGGLDLIVERDAGNPVRILTGNPENSAAFFEELGFLVDEALSELKP